MPRNPPAVRETEDSIEIDAKKGQWPFIKVVRGDKDRVLILIDCNEGGQVINEGAGVAVIAISAKKATRLREFLERTEGLGL